MPKIDGYTPVLCSPYTGRASNSIIYWINFPKWSNIRQTSTVGMGNTDIIIVYSYAAKGSSTMQILVINGLDKSK